MVWALLAWFLLGGSNGHSALMLNASGAQELIVSIESVVTDDLRRSEALLVVEDLESEIGGFEQVFSDSGRQLDRLYAIHDDASDEIREVFSELNSTWEAGQARALDARFRLRELMTEEEWALLFGE